MVKRERGQYRRRPVVETIGMLDGRTFSTQDHWKTIYLVTPAGKQRVNDKEKADLVRLVALQAN